MEKTGERSNSIKSSSDSLKSGEESPEHTLDHVKRNPDLYIRTKQLGHLAAENSSLVLEILAIARNLDDYIKQAWSYLGLVEAYPELIQEAIAAYEKIEVWKYQERMSVALELGRHDESWFLTALEIFSEIQSQPNRSHALNVLAILLPIHLLPIILGDANQILNPSDKAVVLANLARRNSVISPDAEDMVLQILDLLPDIQYPIYRATILASLYEFRPELLEQAIESARSVDNRDLGKVVALAQISVICPELFTEAFEILKSHLESSTFNMVDVFKDLAKYLPNEYLCKYIQIGQAFSSEHDRAEALSSYLSRLPLAYLLYPDWQSHLHLLAHRKRGELMGNLVTLYPAIIALGGEGAMRGVVDEMKRVCGQWK